MPKYLKKRLARLPKISSALGYDKDRLVKIEEQFQIKLPKKVYKVSSSEYSEKADKAYVAAVILDEQGRGRFFIKFINEQLFLAQEAVLNNTIRDAVQEGFIEGIASKLSFSKKEQIEELSGKYQALKKLKDTLQFWLDDFSDLEKMLDDGKAVIEDNNAQTK